MKEQYVSFKVAKLLKEKGFDWPTIEYYSSSGSIYRFTEGIADICGIMSYQRPTQQMAMRWLWEEKGLNVNAIYGDYPALKKSFWMPQIDSLNGCYGVDDEDFFREYDSREDCIEAALLYCLTNLI